MSRPLGVKGSNGYIPSGDLRKLSWCSRWVHKNVAASLEALNVQFRKDFGQNIYVTDGYRSYSEQVAVKALKGYLAATPGTSNHGWGYAVDLGSGINIFGSTAYNWMKRNGPSFGWLHPSWAEPRGSKPEPWHWEGTGNWVAPKTPVTPSIPKPSPPIYGEMNMEPFIAAKDVDSGWYLITPAYPKPYATPVGANETTRKGTSPLKTVYLGRGWDAFIKNAVVAL